MEVTILKLESPSADLQLKVSWPVRLQVYADAILIFINSKEGFIEIQRHLKVYNGASNSKISYSNSVAFSLDGWSMFDNWELKKVVATNGLKRFNSQLLNYTKQFGYQIWLNNDQKAMFYKGALNKVEGSVTLIYIIKFLFIVRFTFPAYSYFPDYGTFCLL